MKISEKSHRKIESFFRYYFENEDFKLPKIKIYGGGIAGLTTGILRIHGITFGNSILIKPRLIAIDHKNQKFMPGDLMVHEIAHVLQFRQTGCLKFLYLYFREYFQNLKKAGKLNRKARNSAYFRLSFEIEARAAEESFIGWKKRGG